MTEPQWLTSLLNQLQSTTARPCHGETANEKEEVSPVARELHRMNLQPMLLPSRALLKNFLCINIPLPFDSSLMFFQH